MAQFDYEAAFDRNLGLFTEAEQLALRGKCVAIAGLGGAGGFHLLTLARLGIGSFNIADFDSFDLPNFNRQIGATIDTIDQPKIDVLENMARAINPTLRIRRFPQGILPGNIDEFLRNADLFVDGFDFFEIAIRRQVFARCAELDIPAVTAGPIGMGTCVLAFAPRGMSFEQYFRLEGRSTSEQYLRFLVGLAPKGLHRSYIVDPSRIDLNAKRGPSTVAACELCAGVVAVTAAKLLLRRGTVYFAPYQQHFDPYRNKFALSRLRFGNAGALQQLKLLIGRRKYAQMDYQPSTSAPHKINTPLEEILNCARWTPSGDNKQPWRFEVTSPDTVLVKLESPDPTNVYEYRGGEPLILAAGMLLESLRIAASVHGLGMRWKSDNPEYPTGITVQFVPSADVTVDPLYGYLSLRSVERRPYRCHRLTDQDMLRLEQALDETLLIKWYPKLRQRWRIARLCARASNIRLRLPNAFPTHQKIIDWTRKLSPTGIPASTLSVDPLTRRVMRWALESWARAQWLNRIVGTSAITMQMDLLPVVFSAACFSLRVAPQERPGQGGAGTLLKAGMHIQRFWLTATKLGLAVQPTMATLIFADYGAGHPARIEEPIIAQKAVRLAHSFENLLGAPSDLVFMGRVGEPTRSSQECRSTRRGLGELLGCVDGIPDMQN